VAKLLQFAPLSDGEVGVLEAMCRREERFGAGTNIVVEGETPRAAFVVTRGLAHRYRLMPDGRRQILTILLPGDFLDLHGFLLKAMDHSVATFGRQHARHDRPRDGDGSGLKPSPVGAALFGRDAMQAMLRGASSRSGAAARRRLAYFLCELVWRQRAVSRLRITIRLPFTQTDWPTLG
jgi:hypothetical protein